ncbi:MAG: low temperature requirement protein A [Roseiflexaceae bacterium]|nr:low temperature requirement protein A [Roseiflexaceae bacterium]
MVRRTWWQVPQLRTDEDEHRERRVSWLELFFDLVFVVVIAELAHHLSEHITLQGVGEYALLFVAVWWSWIGGTFYTERFETPDVSYRLFTFLQMLPIAAMAVFAAAGLASSSAAFGLSYAASRALIIFLWLRGGFHAPSFRPVTNRYAIGFSLSVLLFVLSVFIPAPFRYAVWALALVIDLLTPIATLKLQARLPRISTSRLPERFGLFVIIVLGEAIIGVVQAVADQPLAWPTALTGTLGMALVFGIWWIYFDFIARRAPNFGGWWAVFWNYLHVPLVMSIAAVGAAIQNILTLDTEASRAAVFLLLGSAVATALVSMGLIELTLRRGADEPTDHRVSVPLKLAAGLVAVGLGVWGSRLGPIGFLLALLPLLLVQMVYGAYAWFRQELPSEGIVAQEQGTG